MLRRLVPLGFALGVALPAWAAAAVVTRPQYQPSASDLSRAKASVPQRGDLPAGFALLAPHSETPSEWIACHGYTPSTERLVVTARVIEELRASAGALDGQSGVFVFKTSAMADAYVAAVYRRSYQECILKRFFRGIRSISFPAPPELSIGRHGVVLLYKAKATTGGSSFGLTYVSAVGRSVVIVAFARFNVAPETALLSRLASAMANHVKSNGI